MRKMFATVLALSLCLMLALPTAGLADLTNNDDIKIDMTAEQFANLALDLETIDLELKKAEDTAY